ncbi:hypothetical protein STENM36S_06549 [Streptomyces tendae]
MTPLDGLLTDPRPFALLRRRAPGHDHDLVELLVGPVTEHDRLAGLPEEGLALVPFRQIRERGFDVRDDGTPLLMLTPEERHDIPLAEALDRLPAHEVRVEGGGFDVGDEEYARIVGRVLDEEIGRGEGANFVIRRTYEGRVPGFGRADALALFRRLLEGERGAYWTFVVHTGERTLVGASPEVHVRMSGGTVVMNPISGTYRYPAEGPTPEHLLDFLADGKEIEELSMVVDEESRRARVLSLQQQCCEYVDLDDAGRVVRRILTDQHFPVPSVETEHRRCHTHLARALHSGGVHAGRHGPAPTATVRPLPVPRAVHPGN